MEPQPNYNRHRTNVKMNDCFILFIWKTFTKFQLKVRCRKLKMQRQILMKNKKVKQQ